MEYHPVIHSPLGEYHIFYRSPLTWVDEQKRQKELPERRPFVTACQAIAQDCPESWDTPNTSYPLVLSRQKNLLLVDIDGACTDLVAEAQERIPTYWHLSHSGIGRHAIAFTELKHLYGERHLVFLLNNNEKIEIFFNQPAILTNQHTQLLPLRNCDQEVAAWVNDLRNKYKDTKILSNNIYSSCWGGSNGIVFPPERFPSFLTAYASERGFPSAPKRELLRYIWNAPKDPYWHGWMQFHAEKIAAEQFHISPRQMSKHLTELHEHGWIDRRYKEWKEGKRLLSVKLNDPKQVGKENEQ